MWHEPAYTRDPSKESATLADCFKWLKMTSRSFALVVQELNPDLVVPVALFYLVLRGLDTIEDDMTLSLEEKEPLLRSFETVLEKDGWTYDRNGPHEKDRELLVHFDDVITEFQILDPKHRDIIQDITHKMGNGMADYATINGVTTIAEYELYCHYVAGLVGDGLTRFFVADGFANPALSTQPELAESMGQFLQKTNIIRDVREDFDDRRRFWPQEIWMRHVDGFDDLFERRHSEAALACSSEMVLNALRHVEDCLSYMAGIREPGVFAFVAIPQAMAIATLELVFRNPRIFETNVKITRGDAARLVMEASRDLRSVYAVFRRYVRRIRTKNTPRDPNFVDIGIACGKVEQFIESAYPSRDLKGLARLAGDGGCGVVATDKAEALDEQAKSDVFYILLAVLGTLFLISAILVRSSVVQVSRHESTNINQSRLELRTAPKPGSI
jgi:farnesyl-diphosphate farnesyltransferase